MTKQDKKKEFVEKQRKEYTVKVKTLVIGILWFVSIFATFVAGWNVRSDFANEVRSEVRDQMVVIEKPVSKQ